MSNADHLALLSQGPELWNAWRDEHPGVTPELSGADLRGCRLLGVNLAGAQLSRAHLAEATLSLTDLVVADLTEANPRPVPSTSRPRAGLAGGFPVRFVATKD